MGFYGTLHDGEAESGPAYASCGEWLEQPVL
jgi:hypothetical protein